MESKTKRYLTCAETAQLVRKQLKREFPGVKFSVKSSTYSGGASIRVSWTDGPTEAEVKGITSPYEGGGFDPMIDMAYYKETWLLPDGSATWAYSEGTEGSRGSNPGYSYAPPAGAELVSMGADYIFCDRDYSPAFMERGVEETCSYWGIADRPTVEASSYSGYGYLADTPAARVTPANVGGWGNTVRDLVHRHLAETRG